MRLETAAEIREAPSDGCYISGLCVPPPPPLPPLPRAPFADLPLCRREQMPKPTRTGDCGPGQRAKRLRVWPRNGVAAQSPPTVDGSGMVSTGEVRGLGDRRDRPG
jgi:hypothetical protein